MRAVAHASDPAASSDISQVRATTATPPLVIAKVENSTLKP